MPRSEVAQWAVRLATIGREGLRGSPLESHPQNESGDFRSFRDRAGQSHPAHDLLLTRLFGETPPRPDPATSSPDALLWSALFNPPAIDAAGIDARPGPLWPDLVREGIESWTLIELRGLHALWWLGAEQRSRSIKQRALAAASWHVAELQPDNATNRPWAMHVFLLLADQTGSPEAEHFAQTLLHNALITGGGTPEWISAAILLDASRALQHDLSAPDRA